MRRFSGAWCASTLLTSLLFLLLIGSSGHSQNISLVGERGPFPSSHKYGDVWAEGDIACVGAFSKYPSTPSYGVAIFSITNPANPVLLSNYDPNPGGNNQFEQGVVRNRIGYFASWSGSGGGLHIISLTNPASPMLLSRIGRVTGTVTNGHDLVHTMFLERDFLYEADHATPVVKVFNVGNPFAPTFVRNIVTTDPQRIHQITVVSNRLFTSGWGGKTDIYDVSNIGTEAPPLLGSINSGGNSHSSWPTPDGHTLVSCREIAGGDVRFFDITDPANPTLLLTLTPASLGIENATPHNPVIIGNRLYISWYQTGLQIFDISDRTKPVRIGSFDTFPAPIGTLFQGNWGIFPFLGLNKILLSDMQRGLMILDATAVLTGTNNYRPLIVTQPVSQSVNQGAAFTLNVTATGSAPLAYQWRLNGATIAGATNGTFSRPDAQPTDAGNYTVIVSNPAGSITSLVASVTVVVSEVTEVVFADDFDTNSSARWVVFAGSGTGGDHTVEWAYNYSTYFSAYNGTTIPPAPNSVGGTTRGVKLTVNNNDATGAPAGVSLYPISQNFTGAYKVKFDMWINYPGGPAGFGSTGSTEHGTFGLNHTGTRVNWGSTSANPSDGVWFAVDGEGGTSQDYRAYVGNAAASPTLLSFSASGLPASGAASADSGDAYFESIFPLPTFESAGAPGKRWVQVEVGQDTNNILTWRINGNLIAQRVNSSSFTSGTIMIGYMDLFDSIANPAADAFVIFDNVRVEIPTAAVPPTITAQPQSQEVLPGDDVTFTVVAGGTSPLSYQWRFEDAEIAGANASSYTVEHVHQIDAGNYSVIVSNMAGTMMSSNATLSLIGSPLIHNVTATPGLNSAIISWDTEVASTSQVEYDTVSEEAANGSGNSTVTKSKSGGPIIANGHGEFGQASHLDLNIVTNHSVLLTGLTPDTHYEFRVNSQAGTNLYTSGGYHFTTAGTIILDDPDASFTGSWTIGISSVDKYSTNYHYASTVTGAATATATFTPEISTPGLYDVYIWYPQGSNRPTDAQFLVSYNGGAQFVTVNQTANGGDWRLIATGKPFAAGTSGFVRVSNTASISGKVVMADAVRWVYSANQDPPLPGNVPTWWANYYFGTSVDALADHDTDGYSTEAEYTLGTVPTDSNSHLHLRSEPVSGGVQIVFGPHYEGRIYELQSKTEFAVPGWMAVPLTYSELNNYGEAAFTITNDSSSVNFFRLSVQLEP